MESRKYRKPPSSKKTLQLSLTKAAKKLSGVNTCIMKKERRRKPEENES